MKKILALFAVITFVNLAVWAQTPAPSPAPAATPAEVPEVTANGVIGTVKLVDADSKQIIVATKSKGNFIVQLDATTKFVKVPPGARDLKSAEPIELNGIGVGDRVWARGTVTGNNVAPVKQVILMNKAAIEKKNDDERRDWVQRGVIGKVAAVNPQTKEVTLTIQRPSPPPGQGQAPAVPQTQNILLPTEGKIKIRRYTQDTVRFADAKPSTFEEIKVGDQLRALGAFNETRTHYTPEQIVFGTFLTITGKITSIDAAKNEIVITDEAKKQVITLALKPDSTLKRIDFSAMMGGGGMRQPGAGGPPPGGAPGEGGGGMRQPGAGGQGPGSGQGAGPGGGGQGGPRMGGGGRGFDIQALIDRMPETTLAALQVGETIVVAGTHSNDPKRLTAITLLSNVEPLLAMMAARAGGQGGRPSGGGDSGLGGGGLDLGLGLP